MAKDVEPPSIGHGVTSGDAALVSTLGKFLFGSRGLTRRILSLLSMKTTALMVGGCPATPGIKRRYRSRASSSMLFQCVFASSSQSSSQLPSS